MLLASQSLLVHRFTSDLDPNFVNPVDPPLNVSIKHQFVEHIFMQPGLQSVQSCLCLFHYLLLCTTHLACTTKFTMQLVECIYTYRQCC